MRSSYECWLVGIFKCVYETDLRLLARGARHRMFHLARFLLQSKSRLDPLWDGLPSCSFYRQFHKGTAELLCTEKPPTSLSGLCVRRFSSSSLTFLAPLSMPRRGHRQNGNLLWASGLLWRSTTRSPPDCDHRHTPSSTL